MLDDVLYTLAPQSSTLKPLALLSSGIQYIEWDVHVARHMHHATSQLRTSNVGIRPTRKDMPAS